MTLFIQAVKNIKKDAVVHILTVLQLAAVIVVAAILVSSVLLGYKSYEPFSDILRSDGIFCDFTFVANSSPDYDPAKVIADNEMKNFFPEIKNVISCNEGDGLLIDDEGIYREEQPRQILYDDEIIGRYEPELKEGRWIKTSENAECIEAVISENELGIKVGDKIKMSFYSVKGEEMIKDVLVVGKLAENSKIVGYNNSYEEGINIDSLYGTVNYEIEEEAVLLMSANYLSGSIKAWQGIRGPAIMTFSEDSSAERIEEIRGKLSEYNCEVSYLLSDVNKNSLSKIYSHINNLLPIIIVLLIMIAISGISSSALAARREMKSFAVF